MNGRAPGSVLAGRQAGGRPPVAGRRTFTLNVALTLALAGMARTSAAADTVEVEIKGNLFLPETVTVRAGTTVRWTNKERRTTHSVLFPAESLESERLLPEESWQRRFDKPGRHPYTCGPHPEMKGLVIVVD